MNDKDRKAETVAEPDDETTRSDDIAPVDRRQSLRRSGRDRRDPNGRHIRVPDRRKNGDRRITGRRKEDPK